MNLKLQANLMYVKKYKFIFKEAIYGIEVGYILSKYLAGKQQQQILFSRKILEK